MVKFTEDSPDYGAIISSLQEIQGSTIKQFWGSDRPSLKRKRQDSIYSTSESLSVAEPDSSVTADLESVELSEGRLRISKKR